MKKLTIIVLPLLMLAGACTYFGGGKAAVKFNSIDNLTTIVDCPDGMTVQGKPLRSNSAVITCEVVQRQQVQPQPAPAPQK